MIADFNKWKLGILENAKRDNEQQEETFLALVDQASDCCTYEVAKVLMQTFSDKPDYGTQERVISVLSTLSNELFSELILQELPRLITDAPEWAESLIGGELHNNFIIFYDVLKKQTTEIKKAMKIFLKNNDFVDFHPNAVNIKI